MKKTYSCWGPLADGRPNCLVEGEGPLRFKNGEVDPECEKKFWEFEAESLEEAMSIYYLRQGWAPYVPDGNPSECVSCGETVYLSSSGKCWKCGNEYPFEAPGPIGSATTNVSVSESIFDRNQRKISSLLLSSVFVVFSTVLLVLQGFGPSNAGFWLSFGISIVSQFGFCVFVVTYILPEATNQDSKNQYRMALVANILFSFSTSLFIFERWVFSNPLFQLAIVCESVLVVFILAKRVKVKQDADFGYLKATNIFLIAGLTILGMFINSMKTEKILPELLNFDGKLGIELLTPLLLSQGLYELLDRKSKKPIIKFERDNHDKS